MKELQAQQNVNSSNENNMEDEIMEIHDFNYEEGAEGLNDENSQKYDKNIASNADNEEEIALE